MRQRTRLVSSIAVAASGLVSVPLVGCGDSDDIPRGGEPATVAFKCFVQSASMFFWPHGHPADPEFGAPDSPEPHVEVFVGEFPQEYELGYFDALGTTVPGNAACSDVESPGRGDLPSGVTAADTLLLCHAAVDLVVVATAAGVSPAFVDVVTRDGTVLASAQLASDGSSLAYDDVLCELSAPT